MSIENILTNFFNELNKFKIVGYIHGGQCLKYYYNNLDINDICNTNDYDINLYINYKQLNTKETFNIIYDKIIKLYNDLKLLYKLLPLKKFDYKTTKYLPYNLCNKQIDYYNSNIIADLQINTYEITLIDICIIFTCNIYEIKSKINYNSYYLSKFAFNKEYLKYYEDLCNHNNPKSQKIKERIKLIKNINKNSI